MDPFSITVGVAGLLGLAQQTVVFANNYIKGSKGAAKSAKSLIHELEILESNLKRLGEFLRTDSAQGLAFGQTSVLLSSMAACEAKLKALCRQLGAVGESRASRFLWPLNEKEHRDSVQELRAFAQWVQFSLTIDGCALLSKNSQDVLKVLGHQLEHFQMLQEVQSNTNSLEQTMQEQAQTIKDDHDSNIRHKILDWISSFDHEMKHHAIRSPRVEGTGGWLLETEEFQKWHGESPAANLLWCHGIPGSGKSVLSSLTIDYLREEMLSDDKVLAFVYFDFRVQDSQSPEAVIASILKQVMAAGSSLPKSLIEAYEKKGDSNGRLVLREMIDMLQVGLHGFERSFIIIDALDECDETRHRKSFLQTLANLQLIPKVRIFVTSRPYPHDIRIAFSMASQITVEASDSDLRIFLSKEIEAADVSDIIDESFKMDLMERITRSAQGMFLLPALQIQAILNEPTAGEMEDALENMPQTLHEAFKETVARIERQPEGRKRLAMNTLMWISHAMQPLSIEELSEALAIRSGQSSLNPKYRPSKRSMVGSCLGLVMVDEESAVIRLVHYSIQEYLADLKTKIFPRGEETITESCLTYLCSDAFAEGACESSRAIEARKEEFPFLGYASKFWGAHHRNSASGGILPLCLKFLHSQPHRASAIQVFQFSRGYRYEYWKPAEVNSNNGLHVSSYFGLVDVANALLDSKVVEVDEETHMGSTALIKAVSGEHVDLTRMLLAKGADPAKSNWYGSSLHCAAEANCSATIKELLKTTVDVDIRDDYGRTPLHCTVDRDSVAAASILIEHGADLYTTCEAANTSIVHLAANAGSTGLLAMLLRRDDIDLNYKADGGRSPLHAAAAHGNASAVSLLLLRHEIDINGADERGYTPLHYAVARGSEEIVKLLLNAGASATASTEYGTSVLQLAPRPLSGRNEDGSETDLDFTTSKITEWLLNAGA